MKAAEPHGLAVVLDLQVNMVNMRDEACIRMRQYKRKSNVTAEEVASSIEKAFDVTNHVRYGGKVEAAVGSTAGGDVIAANVEYDFRKIVGKGEVHSFREESVDTSSGDYHLQEPKGANVKFSGDWC